MPSAVDRIDFGPPTDAGQLRALGLAILVHAVLIAALTWGVSWKRSDDAPSFSAELWSTTVQQAAPPALTTPVVPTAPVVPNVPNLPNLPIKPPPPAPPPVAAPPKVQALPNADIAIEQEKKRKLAEQKAQREQEDAQDKRQAAMDAKAAKDAQTKRDKERESQKEKESAAKQTEAKRQADEAKKKEAAASEAKATAAAEQLRKQNLARALGMAGAQGDDSSTGTALKSSGPTAGYRSRLAALFKRNIVFSNVDSIQGNPKAEVQVKVSSTGLIMSARLSKSSGVTAWDEAVLRAVEKTERIPLDENGKVVADFPISFGPKD